MAAEQGVPEARVTLAYLYFEGQDLARDVARAEELAAPAAAEGDLEALYIMGLIAQNRENSDLVDAYAWFSLAAEQVENETATPEDAAVFRSQIEARMQELGLFLSEQQIADAQRRADSRRAW
jgi:TPR repeat protein